MKAFRSTNSLKADERGGCGLVDLSDKVRYDPVIEKFCEDFQHIYLWLLAGVARARSF